MTEHHMFSLPEISEICRLEIGFIRDLARFGIVELDEREDAEYLPCECIDVLKMARRLFFDLGINKEGIDVILSMRRRIIALRDEVAELEKKLARLSNEHQYRSLDVIIDKGLLVDL